MEGTVPFRPDHLMEDALNYAGLAHENGDLATARVWYLDLLEQVTGDNGWKHPVTTRIVGSLLKVYMAEGDMVGAEKLMSQWSQGMEGA